MAITLFLSSTLRRYIPGYDPTKGVLLEIGSGITVKDIISRLGIPQKEVKVVMIEGIHRNLDYVLEGKERVALFPPVGGG